MFSVVIECDTSLFGQFPNSFSPQSEQELVDNVFGEYTIFVEAQEYSENGKHLKLFEGLVSKTALQLVYPLSSGLVNSSKATKNPVIGLLVDDEDRQCIVYKGEFKAPKKSPPLVAREAPFGFEDLNRWLSLEHIANQQDGCVQTDFTASTTKWTCCGIQLYTAEDVKTHYRDDKYREYHLFKKEGPGCGVKGTRHKHCDDTCKVKQAINEGKEILEGYSCICTQDVTVCKILTNGQPCCKSFCNHSFTCSLKGRRTKIDMYSHAFNQHGIPKGSDNANNKRKKS